MILEEPVEGRFGEFGGRYIPESLMPACLELEAAFRDAWSDPAFVDEYRGRFGVEPICRALGVSASAYYQRASGHRSIRRLEDERLLCAGPGRLCQALAVTREHDALPLDEPPFALAPRETAVEIATGPRIGITR